MEKPDEKHEAEMNKLLELHVEQLGEHFDNIQIFASRVGDGGDYTESFTRGSGNWHARLGQVRHFVSNHDEFERVMAACAAEDEYHGQGGDEPNN